MSLADAVAVALIAAIVYAFSYALGAPTVGLVAALVILLLGVLAAIGVL